MDFKPPKKLLENLDGGETLITGLKNVRLGARPDYFFLTENRIIYFDEKHLGRYDLSSIPFSKLQEVSAQIGPIRYGSLKITSEEGLTIDLNKIPKGDVEPFVTALENAINAIAVEAISINVKKSLMGKKWSFTKPAEMLLRSRPATDAPAPSSAAPVSDDPLRALQMRLVKGEITKEQYEEMRQYLEGS
jgi:hypothetical protein